MNGIIKSIDTYTITSQNEEYLLVRLMTEDGAYGFGEATLPGGNYEVKRLIRDTVAPFAVGKSVCCANLLVGELYKPDSGAELRRAIAGVEIAAWDAYGKLLNQPVYKLLGGKAIPHLTLYREYCGEGYGECGGERGGVSGNETSGENYYASSGECGGGFGPDAGAAARVKLPPPGDKAIDDLPKIKSRHPEIIFDCGGASSAKEAAQRIKTAAGFDPVYVTGLLPINDEQGWDELFHAADGAMAMAAKASTRADAFPYIINARMSVVEADILDSCGICELRKLAALAHTYYVKIAGRTNGGVIAAAAAYHALLSCANAAAADLPSAKSMAIDNVKLALNPAGLPDIDKPGLGIEIDL